MSSKMKMYKMLFMIFAVLGIVGFVVVIVNGGDENLDFVMIPAIISAVFCALYQDAKKTMEEQDRRMKK